MGSSRLSLVSLFVLFSMLWLPLGQREFLVDAWMKIGTFVAPFILFIFFSCRAKAGADPIRRKADLSSVFIGVHCSSV